MNLRSLLLISALVITALTIHADVIYSTDFPEATNTAPAGWNVLAGGTGSTSSNGWFIDNAQDYRFAHTSGPVGLSAYQGAVSGGFSSTALADVTVEATFRKATNNYITGIVGRASGTNNFYHTRLEQNDFKLYRVNAGSFTQLGSTVTLTGGDIYPGGVAYRILLDMQGTQITARLFDEVDSEVGMISVNDTSINAFTSGYTGLRAQNPSVYETFQITAVPEPSTAILLLVGLGALPWVLRRHRK